MKSKKHICEFTRSKPTATMDTCYCGKFRHNENNKNPIITEIKPATHTPAPWMLANHKQWVISNGGLTLATMQTYKGFEVDACFIVRAVNAHEEMLDALYMALPYVETALEDQGYKPGAVEVRVKQIKDAIAKAEGK